MSIKKYFIGGPSPEPAEPMAMPEPVPEPSPAPDSSVKKRNKYLTNVFGNVSQSEFDRLTKQATYIWNYLLKKGLNKFQAAGILGNMMQESTLNHNRRGTYNGIVQMDKNIWGGMTPIYGESLDGQLNYITDYALGKLNTTKKDKLGHSYQENIGYMSKDYIKAKHNNASDSAYWFANYFERPYVVDHYEQRKGRKIPVYKKKPNGNYVIQEEENRRKYASNLFNYFTGVKFKSEED